MHCKKRINDNGTKLFISMIIMLIFTVIELTGAIMSNSLSLLADVGHMISDLLALFLSWVSHNYIKKAPDEKRSYGYKRLQIIASFTNSITLLLISAVIIIEAIHRMFSNIHTVDYNIMLPIAIIGVASNLIVFFILNSSKDKNLNIRSSILHIVSDMLGFTLCIAAAFIIKFTNWMIIDPILSAVISILLFRSALVILKETMHILLEGTPTNVQYKDIKNELTKILGVVNVHHIHIWSLSEDYVMITLHIVIDTPMHVTNVEMKQKTLNKNNEHLNHNFHELQEYNHTDYIRYTDLISDYTRIIKAIKIVLYDKFYISHSTIEVEHCKK